jgi:hypothetical protein
MDADSYTIMKAIADINMPPSHKLVSMMMALHFHRPSQSVRVRRSTICDETGLSLRTVKTALQALRVNKIFEGQRTGRASIYRVGSRVEEWMAQNLPPLMVQNLPHPDVILEEPCEARYKAELHREQMEITKSYPRLRRRKR